MSRKRQDLAGVAGPSLVHDPDGPNQNNDSTVTRTFDSKRQPFHTACHVLATLFHSSRSSFLVTTVMPSLCS